MASFVYSLSIQLYLLLIKSSSLFNNKAKKWITGRKNWKQTLSEKLKNDEQRIWIHCSSLGEFEQGRPIIEKLKEKYPGHKIVLTFFSPSGYDVQKDYALADYVFYLPIDSSSNAKYFVSFLQPKLAIFVKYEFWNFYLHALKHKQIPVILVSGAFRESQPFFKWYGGFFRKMLQCFDFFFVQDEASQKLVNGIGFNKNVVVSGDTRYDRVAAIAEKFTEIPAIGKFKGDCKLVISGSCWNEDIVILKKSFFVLPNSWKLIIAPHEISAANIKNIQETFEGDTILYSELLNKNSEFEHRVLIIDNIGMLSRLYAYGEIAFVGGGFQKGGIHNILEPAVYGLPVLFGPVYKKFVEARLLVSLNYAFPVQNSGECSEKLLQLISDDSYRNGLKTALAKYMRNSTGATHKIMDRIQKEKWID